MAASYAPEYSIPFTSCPYQICRRGFTKPSLLVDHYFSHHTDKTICFRRSKCGKEFPKYHAGNCHLAKCVGPLATPTNLFHKSQACDRAFETKSGLSAHASHTHPVLPNMQRRAAAAPGPMIHVPRGVSIWSEADTETLVEEFIRLERETNYSNKIVELIPDNTAKQCRDNNTSTTRPLSPDIPTLNLIETPDLAQSVITPRALDEHTRTPTNNHTYVRAHTPSATKTLASSVATQTSPPPV